MRKKKQLSQIEFEALYERSLITAQLMKSRQESVDIKDIGF